MTAFSAAQLASVSHFPEVARVPVLQFAENLPVRLDQFVMLMCMLIAIPLGFLHKYLPNATIKHLYSASLGLALGYLMIGGGIAHSLASCLIVYIAVFTMPASIAPLLTWIFSMGYLSYGHIVRMSMDDTHWGLEFTMFQMVLVAKQIMFAYNVADGAALNAGKKLGVDERSHSFQSQRALLKLPNLLEYLSYMFFFGGLVVGPAFEMKEYLDFTDMTVFKKSKLDSQPSSIVPVLKSLGWVVVTFAGFQASNFVPITYIFTSEYLEHTLLGSALLYRLVFQFWAVTFSRFKYYFVWNLAETACIASGLGFNGIDEKTGAAKWDRVNNIDFVQVETAGTMKELTSGWNRRINHWLTYYIYTRVSTNKTLANVCTKFTSAFWHGFYPGYYQLFLSAVFVQFADDTYHRIFRRFFYRDDEVKDEKTGKTKVVSVPLLPAPLRFFYHFFAFLEVHFMLNYFALAFVLLEIQKGLDAWSTISYAGHFVTFSIIALGFLVPKRRSKRAAAAAAAVTADSNAAAATPAASSAAAAAAPVDAAIPAADEARVTSPARRGRSSRAD